MITVVACHYRLPEYRLRQFLAWNREVFEAFGVRALIVSDVPRGDLPPWARIAIYPGELPVYSPSKVSNYGIRLAAAGIVCKTDIDCLFTREALEEVADVGEGRGVNLPYLMAGSVDELDGAVRWESTKGTQALVFEDWDRISGYDERQEGYGLEDGDGYCRAMKVAKVRRPKARFFHIAHGEAGATCAQGRQSKRFDQWNRSGFCPLRTRQNKAARRRGRWSSSSWGIPDVVRQVPGDEGRGSRVSTSPPEPAPVVPPGREISSPALPASPGPGA